MGLDVGASRVGVALSDEQRVIAQPLTTLKMDQGLGRLCEQIGELCEEHEVGTIVIGLPLSQQGGDRGVSAQLARRVGDRLRSALRIEVVFFDERFSTAEARRLLVSAGTRRSKQRQVVDKVAASLILQGYIDARDPDGAASQ